MDVEFLTAHAVRNELKRLIEEYDEFHWAVAWGTYSTLVELLFAHRAKFRQVTFGVAFSQTDPEIIDALVGVANGYVATKFAGGTYHPKVYGFKSGKRVAAIIGSANFTNGGLGKNLEAAVYLAGTTEDRPLADVLAFAKTCAGYGRPVTDLYAAAYRARFAWASKVPKPPLEPISEALLGSAAQLITMNWAEYVRRVRSSKYHDFDGSLQLLAIARRWFASQPSFAKFSTPQRKAIAGVLGGYEKQGDDLDREWGWLGSMRGLGSFANLIGENSKLIATALDGIPRSGEITKQQYDTYCAQFRRAFAHASRVGGVPTATRLLAMKRPDTFLCICSQNITAAAKEFGFARTTLTLDNYWERVIEPMRLAGWYNSNKPKGDDGELWEARAAMLDALFYAP